MVPVGVVADGHVQPAAAEQQRIGGVASLRLVGPSHRGIRVVGLDRVKAAAGSASKSTGSQTSETDGSTGALIREPRAGPHPWTPKPLRVALATRARRTGPPGCRFAGGTDGRELAGRGNIDQVVFTVRQRDDLRERVLRLAKKDDRVVAGAAVGSLAVDEGDRFSDLDLTFGIADHVPVNEVLNDWTIRLIEDLDAVRLADLEHGLTLYRVFLLPGALQFDLSLTPATQFRPAGPRFRLLFGATAAGKPEVPRPPDALFLPTPVIAGDLFGWGVIYALHARACIERRRLWQAEHYVGAVRDYGLSLACLRHGLPAAQARRYDDLPAETLARFERAHVGAIKPATLRVALAASVLALAHEGAGADVPVADVVAKRLVELR